MIIVRTPLRVSLFGGGTDLPQWYKTNGGAVIGFALNHYVWHTLRILPPFFAHKHRITWSEIELVTDPQDIRHPAVRAILKGWTGPGLEMHVDADLPARSGLGSSSSFTVGLLNAVGALMGGILEHSFVGEVIRSEQGSERWKHQLAIDAIQVEQDVIREAVGSQDQVHASYGGFNRIDFDASGFRVTPVNLSQPQLQDLLDHMLLVFTGFPRAAPVIEADKIDRLRQSTEALHAIRAQVDEAQRLLGDPPALGSLLDAAWRAKRTLSPLVATPALDALYTRALSAGAYGGKLLGAGGGGFFLLVVPPSRRAAVKAALGDLIEVPVGIDYAGSTVVLNGLAEK